MRVLIVDTNYPAFLKTHYGLSPSLESQSYATQWRTLMDTFFGTADAYSHNLSALGHEAHEVVANCAPLQLQWAAEHELRVQPRSAWRDEVVLAQAAELRPDVVYVQDVTAITPKTLRRLRGGGAALVGQIATEPPGSAVLGEFDLMLTSCPHFIPRFRKEGVRCEYLRLAFDSRINERLEREGVSEQHGAVFVGSLKRFRRWNSNTTIERAARRAPVEFWGYGASQWPRTSPIRKNFRGEAWGLEMLRILRGAKIALNRHADIAKNYAINMRLYEATGVGTLLLTDRKSNLQDLFDVDAEVVAYDDASDLAEKIDYFLAHDEERAAIAKAGQARTLRDHSYARRVEELVEILERNL